MGPIDPSRFIVKLVKGTPQQSIKNMLGVFYINQDNYRDGLLTAYPKYTHGNSGFHQFKFASQNDCWEFRTNNLTILKMHKKSFDTDHWRQHNGFLSLNFEKEKYSIQLISF